MILVHKTAYPRAKNNSPNNSMEVVFPHALTPLVDADPELHALIKQEEKRQWFALLNAGQANQPIMRRVAFAVCCCPFAYIRGFGSRELI